MKANPGGALPTNWILGRDELIARIWSCLDRQCVLLHAERRIGKTSVIRKMVDQPRAGWFGVYQDLESIHSAGEFAASVHERIHGFLSRWRKFYNNARAIYDKHDFANITKRADRPWKDLLKASIKDLIDSKPDLRLVLFWDEVPYMIANIAKAEGEQTAAQVLDILRELRQQYPEGLRMLFTGSIGLHHVLSSLHDSSIATEPVNDMYAIEVTPFTPADAAILARDLIAGEGLHSANLEKTVDTLIHETDCFPFYIQHVVRSLADNQLPADPAQIKELVQRHLVAADDPWELAHYRDRIRIYYRDPADAKLVSLLLDGLCQQELPRTLNELLQDVNSQTAQFDDRDRLVRILRLMERDHYLSRTTDGRYQFRFPLIRRWWKLDRGL